MRAILVNIILTLSFYNCNGLDCGNQSFNFGNLTNFPKGFLFGSGTAAYQVEGAWNASGKGESIWDRDLHQNPDLVQDRSNGDIACDSYHKYKEDLELIEFFGYHVHRFSLSWSRLFPNGRVSNPNSDGISYYNNLIDGLICIGVEPMVTLYHWDLPQALEDIGGWQNPEIVDIFGEYSKEVFNLFGTKVKWWNTINEPLKVATGYGIGNTSPFKSNLTGFGEYIASRHVLLAHAKAYNIYKTNFKEDQGGKVSLAINCLFHVPRNDSDEADIKTAEMGNQFYCGWFGHPVYSEEGGYPPVMVERVANMSAQQGYNQSRLPTFTTEEKELIRGTYDYMALNYYSSAIAVPGNPENTTAPSWGEDSNAIRVTIPGTTPTNCVGFTITAEGFKSTLNWVKREYGLQEIFITENGYCDTDTIDDDERISFHSLYLETLLSAMNEDNHNVIGYLLWSLLDNFEWSFGYQKRFGIVRVDFDSPNRTRTIKKSGCYFKQLLEQYN